MNLTKLLTPKTVLCKEFHMSSLLRTAHSKMELLSGCIARLWREQDRCFTKQSCHLEFWAEACHTAVYFHTRSPKTALKDETPFERLFGRRPDISNLRVFGCVSYVHIPDDQRRKLDAKARKGIFVGYPPGIKGY